MWYGGTKSLLESSIRWLKTLDPQADAQNDGEWQSQTEVVKACLGEMVQMTEPAHSRTSRSRTAGLPPRYVHRPVAEKLNRAMPHVRAMLTAMRDRDRTA